MEEIKRYVKKLFPPMKVDLRSNLIKFFAPDMESMAESMARIRIWDMKERKFSYTPFPAEIKYELRFLMGESRAVGNIYEGIKMSEIYRNLIHEKERCMKHCHIVFTNRLFATWDENDARYHLRVSVYSIPSIISLSGIVEAPAKPRDYYIKLYQGVSPEILKNIYRGKYIDYEDERMTEVVKGYVLQAIVFHSTEEAFCGDRNCRLFNAHWQEDMIFSQLDGKYEICPFHKKIIQRINDLLEGRNE